jgi:uncharacterized membrane protein
MLIGIGMGGFFDGILFHQILQTHNMLSAKYPTTGTSAEEALANIEINMFWDGLFHALTWMCTVAGIALLWRVTRRRDVPHATRTLLGGAALGWGLFNLVEGIIDHHILHLHHVVEGANHLIWDLAFLGSGLFLIALGLLLIGRRFGPASVAELSGASGRGT